MIFNFEDIKNRIISYEGYIKTFLKKNGKTLKSNIKLSKEFLEKEFGEEILKYNQKTDIFNEYMIGKEIELNKIEYKKRSDKEKLNNILIKINKNLELLEDENITLEEINLDLNEYKSVLLNFTERFNDSTSKIDELINGVGKYEKIAKDEIFDKLEILKKDIQEFFQSEQNKISIFLEKKGKNIINDKFNIEKLKLNEEKREAFNFELRIFFKYLLLFLLAFGISIIDFLLVQHIVIEEFNLGRNANKSSTILVYYIIPFLPSFVLIFGEFLAGKYLKYNKILIWVVHIFSFISVLFILFTVFFTFNDFKFELVPIVNMFDLLSRILIFVIAIPITIAILSKFFKTDEFFDFIRHLFLPIIFIFLSIKYFFEHFILKERKSKLLKESYIFKLDLSELNFLINKEYKLNNIFIIPNTFNENLNQIGIKSEKALSNIKDLQAFLSKDEIKNSNVGFFSRLFGLKTKNNNIMITLDGKIKRLKNDIRSISSDIEEQESIIDKKYQKDIDNINDSISFIKENRKIYKKQYEENRITVENAITEALDSLK